MSRYSERTWNPNLPEVPVDSQGNWLSYPSYGHQQWETVFQPFYATMKIDGMRTGRSSKVVILVDVDTKKTYPMFIADLVKIIQQGAVDIISKDGEGYLTAHWTASKRGANYGIKAVVI